MSRFNKLLSEHVKWLHLFFAGREGMRASRGSRRDIYKNGSRQAPGSKRLFGGGNEKAVTINRHWLDFALLTLFGLFVNHVPSPSTRIALCGRRGDSRMRFTYKILWRQTRR